jgi:UDP-GlcNAc:undecaprenyl-phosphate GlcNAc-1-phosphate transferase
VIKLTNLEIEHIVIFILSFFLAYFVTPYIIKVAKTLGAIDLPEKRKVHHIATPRLGGLGIFLTFIIMSAIFIEPSRTLSGIIISSTMIVLLGIMDDIKSLKPIDKFIGQFLSASILVLYGNLIINNVNINMISLNFQLGILAIPISIVFVVAIINAINLIDGLDGLSTGLCAIYFLTIIIISIIKNYFGLEFQISLIFLGSLLAFLRYNFHPAKIFQGDTGSMLMGLIIASIAIMGFKSITARIMFIPILILAIPILDTVFAIVRRKKNKQKIFSSDKQHIHHQILNFSKNNTIKTVMTLYLINAVLSMTSILYILNLNEIANKMMLIMTSIVIIFVYRTSVIFKK